MLYYIFRWLDQFGISGSHMWSYISFRAILAMVLALIISAWFGEYFIKLLKRKQITETQRDAKIDPFGVNKVGVPSMGGIIIILSLSVICVLAVLTVVIQLYHTLPHLSRGILYFSKICQKKRNSGKRTECTNK